MNTSSSHGRPTIRASYLGPIFFLKGTLSSQAQNLIFARNGTGKSFLARAFRYLDLYGQDEDVSKAASDLLSDEANDGKGSFSFSYGPNASATLDLEKSGSVNANISNIIFHVFSEDFVQKELRDNEFKIKNDIENRIIVGSDNIEIQDEKEELNKAMNANKEAHIAFQQKFEDDKNNQLIEKAGVHRNLTAYKIINLENLLSRFSNKPSPPDPSFSIILKDLDNLKNIPTDRVCPDHINTIRNEGIDMDAVEKCLQKVTSPSNISDEFKNKIDAHYEFYETGTKIIQGEHYATCPFCEQDIKDKKPKEVIEAYINYFVDAEAKHKSQLRDFLHKLKRKSKELREIKMQIMQQKLFYDDLKQYIPSMKSVQIQTGEDIFKIVIEEISTVIKAIEQKTKALATVSFLPCNDLSAHIVSINVIIEQNNKRIDLLTDVLGKTYKERREIQGEACNIFAQEFAIANWSSIEELDAHQKKIQFHEEKIKELEKANRSQGARRLVADTFRSLLNKIFVGRYVFDEQTFVLKRGDKEMLRGPHRTLSDGEKTAIAFCWFIACIHRKVKKKSDYSKVFLVCDDPVTSMSYDFIFSIAQTLRDVSIFHEGGVSVDPATIVNRKGERLNLLILTHSSYFFNISSTNGVVYRDATFSLHQEGNVHKLESLRKYVTPFEQQLKHVFNVSEGCEPDYSTANAVRSILEAIGHFCRPDRSKNLQDFVTFLAQDEGIKIESVLINSFCHGKISYEETPTPEDLKRACEVTVAVVKRFALGQLELIKNDK